MQEFNLIVCSYFINSTDINKKYFKMYILERWVLSFLLLGHQIDGVNREILNSFAVNDPNHRDILSKETRKIMNLYHENSKREETKLMTVTDFVPTSYFARNIRSVSNNFRTLCSPMDSCVSRCGKPPKSLLYTCNCDYLCRLFSDCCIDYRDHCQEKGKDYTSVQKFLDLPKHGCDILYMKYNLFVVSQCSAQYQDVFNKKLCSVKMPKECEFSDTFNASAVDHVYKRCKETVYSACMTKLSLKCNAVVEPKCNSIMSRRCNKYSSSQCRKCNNSFWPVSDETGIIYRNSYCALCNLQKNYTLLTPKILSFELKQDAVNVSTDKLSLLARHCTPAVIDSCPNRKKTNLLKDSCYNHSGAVATKVKKGVIYKNIYCALCNGEKLNNLECDTNSFMRGLIRPLLKNFITAEDQGMLDDIPAAFSILLNFGLDGRERMYFSSEREEEMRRHQERCGKGKIWDPFSEVCRKLYCSTEFVLVDYLCVRKETPEENFDHENETSVIPDSGAEFVHLTLSAEMEMLDFLQFNGLDIDTISETVRESLASSFDINIERIRNVRFNISLGHFGGLNDTLRFIEEMDDLHPIIFKIDFDLHEDEKNSVTAPGPTVDSIVSMLASSLSMNGFEFDINNLTSRIFEIHQTLSPLTSWCNAKDGGQKKEYWNSEFDLVLNEQHSALSTSQIRGIHVNKTDKFYPQGKFIADILFQGYQFSGSLINVSGVAVVCDFKPKLNESCIRILVSEKEYILENGSLSIHNASLKTVIDDSMYEEADNGNIWVCLKSLQTFPHSKRYHMDFDIEQALVSYVLLWISAVALAIVLITYISFESLRNLPGCNTMNLTFSLIAMQMTFIFGQRTTVKGRSCAIVGHILHYEILCCFTWMNVMAFDLFQTFGNRNILSNIRSKSKFLPRYMAYAYFAPVTVITTSSLLDYYISDSSFSPHYGEGNVCWITSKNSAILFFATPLAVIMFINFVFFVLTILAIRSVKNVLQLNNHKTNQKGKNDVFLYARMALVVGLTWTLSFIAAFIKKDELVGKVLTYLFIIFNTLQGVFIFFVFVCNRRVYELYREVFMSIFSKLSKHVKHEGTSSTITRLANVMKRTVSTDTVVSSISNTSTSSSDSRLSIIPEYADDLIH